ncbi:T9SS type A sorting domain-containing protein [Flavobacterium lipolyticum]|uniref:T9SS type A sorting domain-containing protein n=1 Tax=Flavobacterium lipolyticum TaxID=2893754 RepID=A0ABS8M2X9_9FLAO|nr:T9SS type A sorting domain-containing protein [Flavobacterium sp. F-126]MCC9019166.1 T9SS type A sorting domain-containing protein [Flavobacterium sp. F-126]
MKTKLLLLFLLCTITEMNAQQKIYDFTSYPWNFKKFNDKIIFEASEENIGREIWQSDGTASNTKLLKDIYSGPESSSAGSFRKGSTVLNNNFYFIARDVSSSGEIWKTDGTTAGTVKVTNFLNGRALNLTTVGNAIFFLVQLDIYTSQVWKTDGTKEGTVLLKDNLIAWNGTSFQGKCNNNFIFTISPAGGVDSVVWRSDGTSEGTYPITAPIDGNGSDPRGTHGLTQYIEHNNKLYFVSRYFLYETDGTLENTKIIGNVWNAQRNLVQYSTVIEVNNNLYFMFFSAELYKLSIWKFDSVNRNVTEIYSKNSLKYFSPSNFAKNDNSLLFSSPNENGGTSLVSLNLANYTESNLGELSNGIPKPSFIYSEKDTSTIFKFNNDEYFIASVDKDWFTKGYILDLKLNKLQYSSALDNVLNVVSYGDNLYYSKDNKLWKYSNNLSIPLIESGSSLVFYPNPATDFVNIQDEYKNDVENVQIFDLNGKVVSGKTDFANDKIDVSRLNQGTYILKAKVKGTVISKKIIKN